MIAWIAPSLLRSRTTASLASIFAASLALVMVFDLSVADAQSRKDDRVEFTLIVDRLDDDFGVDEEGNVDSSLRVQKHREMANETARRIEQRLDNAGAKNHEVTVDDNHHIDILVFGDHSESAVKSAVIPPGRLEIRPIVVGDSPWLDVEEEFPADVEVRVEPGSFQFDQVFLFAPSADDLRRVIDRHAPQDSDFAVFPYGDGWRTLNLGRVAATHDDVDSANISQNPSGTPFISVELSANASQNVSAYAASVGARNLAIVLDGEIVALHSINHRRRSTTFELDPPDHLRSLDARGHWATQVAGRLGAHIPIRLAEIQE